MQGSDSKKTTDADGVFSLLKRLLHLANDLCLAYGTAIRRIKDASLKEKLSEMDKSHDRYRVELAEFIEALGQSPPEGGDLHGVVERGRVVIAELGGDEAILRAMSVNEAELAVAYQAAKGMKNLPPKVVEFLERAVDHEQHHRRFFDDALGRFVG